MNEFVERVKLAWKILRGKDGTLQAHAKGELAYMLNPGDDGDLLARQNLIDLTRVFSTQGHSGASASFVTCMLNSLLKFEPIGPLRGTEDEWVFHNYGADMYAQNARCGHVFMRTDETSYDSQRVIFREPDGVCFMSGLSRVDITFPYVPEILYADVPFDATDEQKIAAKSLALENYEKSLTISD